ncbi:MAG: zinc ribbon domain-containing protein [Thermoplasmata archaeon]
MSTSGEVGSETRSERPKWPRRMSRKAEVRLIKSLPKMQKAIVISKVSAVILFAIGLEGVVTSTWWLAAVFLPLGVLFTVWPVRMNMPNVCPRCGHISPRDAGVCEKCGTALM